MAGQVQSAVAQECQLTGSCVVGCFSQFYFSFLLPFVFGASAPSALTRVGTYDSNPPNPRVESTPPISDGQIVRPLPACRATTAPPPVNSKIDPDPGEYIFFQSCIYCWNSDKFFFSILKQADAGFTFCLDQFRRPVNTYHARLRRVEGFACRVVVTRIRVAILRDLQQRKDDQSKYDQLYTAQDTVVMSWFRRYCDDITVDGQ